MPLGRLALSGGGEWETGLVSSRADIVAIVLVGLIVVILVVLVTVGVGGLG